MRKDTTTTADAGPPSLPQDTSYDVGASMAFLNEWNAEITQFYLKRCQEYWSLPGRLQSCELMDDLRAVQQDFQHALVEDYRDEAARLARVVRATSKRLNPEPETDYETALLKAQRDAAAIIEQAKDQAERILASARKQAEGPAETAKETPARKSA